MMIKYGLPIGFLACAAAGFLTYAFAQESANAAKNKQLDVIYHQVDGKDLGFDFVKPSGKGPFPLVVCVHGGGWRAGSRKDYKDFQNNIANIGVASVSVQYRLAPGAKFPAQLDDLQNALEFILKDPERFPVDRDKIIWMGGSAGGHLVLLAGFDKKDSYKTRLIINVAGPTDLKSFQSLPSGDKALQDSSGRNSSQLLEDLLGTSDRNAPIYERASPIFQIQKDSPRVLTLHGDKDDIVPFTQAQTLHERLKELGVPEQLIVATGGGHDFAGWNEKERNAAILDVVKAIQDAIQ